MADVRSTDNNVDFSMNGTSRQLPASNEKMSLYTALADVLSNYAADRKTGNVVDYRDYNTLKNDIKSLDLDIGSQSWDDVWSTVEAYLANSVKTAHPLYFNQLWAGQSEAAFIGSVVEALANTSMYTYEVAPVATIIENEMLRVLKSTFGFEDGEAQVTTGGSNSNYLALLLALHRKFPGVKQTGLHGLPKCAVFVSSDAHYSMDKAAVMSGIGLNSLFKISTDCNGVMNADELQGKIRLCKEDGYLPVSIIGTAGTTVRGAFDNFDKLANIASEHDCWLHVDGAWGGAVAYASTEKKYLKGIERADSMTWDAHKMLGVPLMCGVLFTRHTGGFDQVCNLGDTLYIFHESDDRQDLGPYSLQCGRRVDMLKLWLEYIYYGEEGFGNRIDHFMRMAKIAEERINSEPTLELQSKRWINNLCFRSVPGASTDLEKFNRLVRERLYKSGSAMVNMAYIDNTLTIRLIITNKDVTESDIHEFFDLWLSTAAQLEEEWIKCA